jgi:hypothetical protein
MTGGTAILIRATWGSSAAGAAPTSHAGLLTQVECICIFFPQNSLPTQMTICISVY